MENIEFKNITLFPKKATLMGLLFTFVLMAIASFLIYTMSHNLKVIEEEHFPTTERSAINVRLINLVDYQLKLALSNRDLKIVEDLKINFMSLEQNFNTSSKNTTKSSSQLFSLGKEIIKDLEDRNWILAKEKIDSSQFNQQIEGFSFEIFDRTEEMANQRDKQSQKIQSFIKRAILVSIFIIVFLLYIFKKIYNGYSSNLSERLFAENKARQLSKQRQSLIHVLCHDLGNPVSAIFSLIDIAHLLPQKEKDDLIPKIKENAQISLDIIELTKKMQAIETGKFSLDLVPVNLDQAIKKSLIILRERIETKKIKLDLNHKKDQVVLADETSLVNSILNNILTNSIKFSKEGSSISLNTKEEAENLIVTISDKGIGMPADILHNVFDESVETSRQGTDGESGTGFGMPLVKKFMEAFGGSISLTSSTAENESGTTTTLVFKVKP